VACDLIHELSKLSSLIYQCGSLSFQISFDGQISIKFYNAECGIDLGFTTGDDKCEAISFTSWYFHLPYEMLRQYPHEMLFITGCSIEAQHTMSWALSPRNFRTDISFNDLICCLAPTEHGEILKRYLYSLRNRLTNNIKLTDIDWYGAPWCGVSFLASGHAKECQTQQREIFRFLTLKGLKRPQSQGNWDGIRKRVMTMSHSRFLP
jgi:hypothetical protein